MLQMLLDLSILIEALLISLDVIKFILRKTQPEKLAKSIEEFQLKFANTNPLVVVEGPLIILRQFYNYLFGRNILSRESILRASIATVLLIIILFIFKIWSLGIHKAMTFSPWELYDVVIASTSPSHKVKQTTPPNIYLSISQAIADFLFNHRSPLLKASYCITFTIIVLLFSCIATILSLALTRRLINDMLPTGGFSVLIGATLTTLAIAFMLITIPITITFYFTFPTLPPLILPFIPALLRHYLVAIAILPELFTISGILLLRYVPWFQTVAIITLSPTLLLLSALILSIASYSHHKQIHTTINRILIWLAKSKPGFLTTLAIGLNIAFHLIHILISLFSKHL